MAEFVGRERRYRYYCSESFAKVMENDEAANDIQTMKNLGVITGKEETKRKKNIGSVYNEYDEVEGDDDDEGPPNKMQRTHGDDDSITTTEAKKSSQPPRKKGGLKKSLSICFNHRVIIKLPSQSFNVSPLLQFAVARLSLHFWKNIRLPNWGKICLSCTKKPRRRMEMAQYLNLTRRPWFVLQCQWSKMDLSNLSLFKFPC